MNRVLAAVGALSALVMSGAATATPGATNPPLENLTFDDVTTQFFAPIPQGYGGLQWYNFGVVDAALANPVGFQNGVASVSYVATNPDTVTPCPFLPGAPACSAVGGAGRFTLRDAYLAGAARDGLEIAVLGFRGLSLVDAKGVSVDTLGPTFVKFNFSNIDTLVFVPFGGTLDPAVDPAQDSTLFALDNLRVQFVPEPATLALFGLGLAGLALRRRAR